MRTNWLSTLCFFIFFAGAFASARAQVLFEVPDKIQFAGLDLYLDEGAKQVVRQHGQGLVKNPKFYRQMTERADAYFPIVEKVFAEEGLPNDFKYLCIQESGLVSNVVSSSKAVGYWQFKAETATDVGMRVDDEVDERMHIVSSSRGAAKYLKKNNQYMNNWAHTLISFYAGLGGARNLIDPADANAIEMRLTEKTHFYLMKFLAHKIAFEGSINRSPNPVLQVMAYENSQGKTLRQVAAETNVPIADVEFYNKWCKGGVVPTDKPYSVMVPVKAGERPSWMAMATRPAPTLGENLKPWKETRFFGLIAVEEPKKEEGASQPLFLSWNGIKAIMARKEDNINRLALAANVSKEEILEYNDLRIFDLIVPGQTYYVRKKNRKAKVPFHTARQGETLWEVAQNYGLTLSSLLRKNRMRSVEKLQLGRILWLRHTRPEEQAVEFDKTMPASPTLPLSVPIMARNNSRTEAASTAVASTSNAPILIATSSNRKFGESVFEAVQEKYDTLQIEAGEAPLPVITPESMAAMEADTLEVREEVAKAKQIAVQPAKTETAVASAQKPAAPVAKVSDGAKVENGAKEAMSAKTAEKAKGKAGYNVHVVEPGQTAFAIARLYGIRTDSLLVWNPGAAVGLNVGQEVYYKLVRYETPVPKSVQKMEAKMAAKSAASDGLRAPQPGTNEYMVQAGDTFFGIAKRNGLSVSALKSLNGLESTDVKLGQVLRLR